MTKLEVEDNSLILYGAGTGAELILSIVPEKICCIVDNTPLKQGKHILGKKIYAVEHLKKNNNKIIVSVFGRFNEVLKFLCHQHSINKKRIISLDL